MAVISNIDHFTKRWEARARKIEGECRKATSDATKMVYAASRDELNKGIYNKPEDTLERVAKDRDIWAMKKSRKKVRRRVGIIEAGEREATYQDVEEMRDVMEAVPGRYITIKGKKGKRVVIVPLRGKDKRKKAWRRTGNLKRSEKMKIVSAYEGIIFNNAGYAWRRHELGMAGHRKTRRIAPWRLNAIRRCRKTVKAIYRRAIIMSMRAGKIPGP